MIGLDTNVVIAAVASRPATVRARLDDALRRSLVVGLPAVALFELSYGAAKSVRRAAGETTLQKFLAMGVIVWPFEAEDAAEAGDIRAALEATGAPIGPYDILIAAQARRRSATLVTANRREFARVPGLILEDWTD